MKDLNEAFVHLNVGLPDDVERLKAAGYYKEAVARIDEYLAEDWTETQNSPRSQGLEMPEYEQPANPVPHGVDALRDALLVQKEIMRRLPQEYCWNEAQAVARMQGLVRDFTVEEFRQLVHEGRESVHVRAWLPIPAECLAQSEIELQRFTEQPGCIADANAPQRTVCWEADLTENRRFGVQYRYKTTAVYADPLDFVPAPEQPTFDTEEQAPHIVFTPYLRALAAQLTEGITDPAEKAKRIYDYVTLNVRYHYQPAYFVQECLPDRCARNRRGDCGIMALTFITLCRLVGIPARWQSGLSVSPTGVGCHDWAMFYIAPKGWMYADCSFGASMARQGEEELRRHYFGSLDTGRMVANRAFEAPFDPPMYGFRSDPYDNQSGECEVDGVGLYGDALDTRKELVDFEGL